MKLAIMQPYFLPYIGHVQLMNVVDTYVLYDDVNYFQHPGWINRNRIMMDGNEKLFTLPLSGASCNKLINEISILDLPKNKSNILKTMQYAYRKAPYAKEVFPILENIILCAENNLAKYIEHSIRVLSTYLDIKTTYLISSNFDNDKSLRGQDKVIEICKLAKADTYINAYGAMEKGLYDRKKFEDNGLKLHFIKTRSTSKLSIVDTLMNHGRNGTKELLNEYDLI